jgi:hypothetical protein
LIVPVTALVVGLVGWYVKVAGTDVRGARLQPVAVSAAVLIIVANAVTVPPTWTERLVGSTAANKDWALLVDGRNTSAQTTIRMKHRHTVGASLVRCAWSLSATALREQKTLRSPVTT